MYQFDNGNERGVPKRGRDGDVAIREHKHPYPAWTS